MRCRCFEFLFHTFLLFKQGMVRLREAIGIKINLAFDLCPAPGHIRNISESRIVLELVVKSFKQLFQSSRSVALWGTNGDRQVVFVPNKPIIRL